MSPTLWSWCSRGAAPQAFEGNRKGPVLRGEHRPLQFRGPWEMTVRERRTDLAKRQRIDDLLDRVRAAREEIVESGLSAVHGRAGSRAGDDGPGRACAHRRR